MRPVCGHTVRIKQRIEKLNNHPSNQQNKCVHSEKNRIDYEQKYTPDPCMWVFDKVAAHHSGNRTGSTYHWSTAHKKRKQSMSQISYYSSQQEQLYELKLAEIVLNVITKQPHEPHVT